MLLHGGSPHLHLSRLLYGNGFHQMVGVPQRDTDNEQGNDCQGPFPVLFVGIEIRFHKVKNDNVRKLL